MSTKLIRLTSGEEVIANVTKENDDIVEFDKPIVLIPAGEGKLGFMPFMPYTKAEEGLTISKQFVVFAVDPIEDLVEQHRQATSSIQLTQPQGIIT
jgi:hypothetical protein